MTTREDKITQNIALFQDEASCIKVLNMLSLLSNKARLQTLCLLKEGEYNVTEMIQAIGCKPSIMSQHIKLLSLAGYIKGRRQEKNIYYSIVDTKIVNLLNFLQVQYIKGNGEEI